MTKKRVLVAMALFAFVGVVMGVLAMLPARLGVTKANFDRIENGMTVEEVEKIFGGLGGERSPWPHVSSFAYLPGDVIWRSDGGAFATITFSGRKVIGKGWHNSEEMILDKVRRWLHLR